MGGTYEATEDLIARFHVHRATIVIDRGRDGGLAIRTKGAVQPDALHGVMHDLLVCFRRIL